MNTPTDNSGNRGIQMTPSAFLALGSMHVAYVKPVTIDGAPAYAIHAANGQELAVYGERELAFVAARQNDLEPVSVH